MADDDNLNSPKQQGGNSVLDQAMSAINKAEKEAVVSKLKDILKRKKEAEKAMRLCDVEIEKLVSDFQAGLL